MSASEKRRLLWSALLALLTNALIVGLLLGAHGLERVLEKSGLSRQAKTVVVRNLPVDLLSPKELERLTRESQLLVQTQSRPTKPSDVKTPARFAGERTQRVERETKQFLKPGVRGGNGGEGETGVKQEAQKGTHRSLEDLGFGSRLGSEERLPQEKSPGVKGGARPPDLDSMGREVAMGTETLLNTDEFKQASFFNRLSEQLEPLWHENLQRTRARPLGVFYSHVRISTNAQGELDQVTLVGSSGVPEFDVAAFDAVDDSLHLSNLPRDFRDERGYFQFVYTFKVTVEREKFRMELFPQFPTLNRGF